MQEAGESGELLRIGRQAVRKYPATVGRPQRGMPPLPADASPDRGAAREERLCRDVPAAGKQVHDATIVATVPAHGERRLLTVNGRDVRRDGRRSDAIDGEELR